MALHRPLQKRQCSLAISVLRGKNLKHLAFVIHRPPQIMHLTIDLHEDLVQVPAPLRQGPQRSRSLLPDLCGKHRTEPIPPEPHRLVADINTALMEQIFDLSQ